MDPHRKNFLFVFIYTLSLVSCETTVSPSTIHFIRSRRDNHVPKHLHTQGPIIKGASAFECSSVDKCQKIEEFFIAENYTYNCFESLLPINYYKHEEASKKLIRFGYLTQNGKQIVENQKYTEECRKIRR